MGILRLGAAALALSLLFAGCIWQEPGGPPAVNSTNATNRTNGTVDVSNGITRQMCESYGGHWNECGSPCRGEPPGTACIMMCVLQCECGGIAGFRCPPGYVCTDYLPGKGTPDAMGVCKKISD